VTDVTKWYEEKHDFSALLRLLDKKLHRSLGTPVHTLQYHCFGLSVSVIDYNTTDLCTAKYTPTHSSTCRSFRSCPCFTTYQVNIYHGHSCCTCFMTVVGVVSQTGYSRERCISVLKYPPLILCDSQWRMLQETAMHWSITFKITSSVTKSFNARFCSICSVGE